MGRSWASGVQWDQGQACTWYSWNKQVPSDSLLPPCTSGSGMGCSALICTPPMCPDWGQGAPHTSVHPDWGYSMSIATPSLLDQGQATSCPSFLLDQGQAVYPTAARSDPCHSDSVYSIEHTSCIWPADGPGTAHPAWGKKVGHHWFRLIELVTRNGYKPSSNYRCIYISLIINLKLNLERRNSYNPLGYFKKAFICHVLYLTGLSLMLYFCLQWVFH